MSSTVTSPRDARALRTADRPAAAVVAGRILFGALLLVLALSPFEAGYPPLGRFLWATYTNLEVILFLLAAAWLLVMVFDGEARRRLRNLPLLLPVAALLAAHVLSTIMGEYRAQGVHTIYRLLMGVLVFSSVYEVVRTRGRLLAVVSTFAGAASLSAVLGLLEFAPAINIQPWLRAFKPQPTAVGGMLRLSGTFEYANGAAMFFEMALPILISLAIIFSSRRMAAMLQPERPLREPKRWALLFAMMGLVGICVMALVLTFSRASLLGVGVTFGVYAVALLMRRKSDSARVLSAVWRSLGVALGVMVLGGIVVFATQPMFRLRLTTQNDRDWYRASLSAGEVPSLSAKQVVTVAVTVRNDGKMTWECCSVLPVHISYHWMSATDNVYLYFDGLRTGLPHDVSPGESVSVVAVLEAPPVAGDYRLRWDMVHENVTWFDRKDGMQAPVTAMRIAPAVAGGPSSGPTPSASMPEPLEVEAVSDTASVERAQLWKVAFAMFQANPIFGVGPDGFRNLYGKYAGVDHWNKNIYTNNTYLEMFTNLGLLGGLAFLWLVLLAAWKAIRSVLRLRVGPTWVIGLGATAAVLAFLVHGVVDYFLFSTPIYVAFWFLLSVAVRPASDLDVTEQGAAA